MEFYLTGPDGKVMHFPMNPEKVDADTGANMTTFEVLSLGSVKFPRGKTPAQVSWDGLFPGAGRVGQPFVKDWRPPIEFLDMLQTWRDTGARLRLLITESAFNLDVYIERLGHSLAGGMGDVPYKLQLSQHRDLVLLTDTEWQARAGGGQSATSAATRPTQASPASYTVAESDTLWDIAKRLLGDGSQWRRIYDANQDVIGADPDLIQPGQVLSIPAAGGAAP